MIGIHSSARTFSYFIPARPAFSKKKKVIFYFLQVSFLWEMVYGNHRAQKWEARGQEFLKQSSY